MSGPGRSEPFEGRFYGFEDGVTEPQPVRGADLPLLIGGRSPAALRRAAREASFWQTTTMTPETFPAAVAAIRAEPRGAEVEVGSVYSCTEGIDAARRAVDAWTVAGAQHLSVSFGPFAGRLDRMREFARAFGLTGLTAPGRGAPRPGAGDARLPARDGVWREPTTPPRPQPWWCRALALEERARGRRDRRGQLRFAHQPSIDARGARATLGDRPHDQALTAAHVAAREDARRRWS